MTLRLAALALVFLGASAHARFVVEGMLGGAYSLPSQLTIYQENQPTLRFRATYSNETFKQAPYYALRVGGWTETSGWEFEKIHHKVVVNNPPAEVQAFKATFGFNLFLINRAWDVKWFILRVGLGPVIAHPITTVRGLTYNSSAGGILGTTYFFVGAGTQLSLQRRFFFGDRFFLHVEGKFTFSVANIPVANGTSTLSNYALHGLGGVGYRF